MLARSFRWTQIGLAIFISILSLQIVLALWSESNEFNSVRAIGIVAVVIVLLTLFVPICSKLNPKMQRNERVTLVRESEGIYRGEDGARYQVIKI